MRGEYNAADSLGNPGRRKLLEVDMKRIAFVNQRYGREVNGGSEYYTRLIAEHLTKEYEVEVLTTKALDYTTWEDHYTEDVEDINGVTVRRFSVDRPREMKRFLKINDVIPTNTKRTPEEEEEWMDEQGPYCPKLINYIREQAKEYDLFIFVTYLYYTTCRGIEEVADKAVLIPTAHDEPYIYFSIFQKEFHLPKAIVYLTEEEKEFVQGRFHNEEVASVVTAVGVDLPPQTCTQEEIAKLPEAPYLIYVGRIEGGKGCGELFSFFEEYKRRNPNQVKLVLMGKEVLEIPKHPDIIYLGFVSEEMKFEGIRRSMALVLPSYFESLSISVLEALQVKTPVLVNGHCHVLKGHCTRSNAGLYYKGYEEFEGSVNYLERHPEERAAMGENGALYVERDYQWGAVVHKLKTLFDNAMED